MVKARGVKGGREILVLGLSHANLDRLREHGTDGYILVQAKDVDISCDIYITAAPTEHDLFDAILPLCGPGSKLNISPRLKS